MTVNTWLMFWANPSPRTGLPDSHMLASHLCWHYNNTAWSCLGGGAALITAFNGFQVT